MYLFQLMGGLLIGIGLYAFVDKWQLTGWVKLENVYDVILNISLVMVMMGGVVFIVSFAGCVGALRENTCLLKFVSICYNNINIMVLIQKSCLFAVFFMPSHFLPLGNGHCNCGIRIPALYAVYVGREFH